MAVPVLEFLTCIPEIVTALGRKNGQKRIFPLVAVYVFGAGSVAKLGPINAVDVKSPAGKIKFGKKVAAPVKHLF